MTTEELQHKFEESVRRREAERQCPECGTCGLVFKLSLGGDEEGRNTDDLYQCPKCKELVVNP